MSENEKTKLNEELYTNTAITPLQPIVTISREDFVKEVREFTKKMKERKRNERNFRANAGTPRK
jgi:hypothetical protein